MTTKDRTGYQEDCSVLYYRRSTWRHRHRASKEDYATHRAIRECGREAEEIPRYASWPMVHPSIHPGNGGERVSGWFRGGVTNGTVQPCSCCLVVQDRIWAIDRRANDDAFDKPPFCETTGGDFLTGYPIPSACFLARPSVSCLQCVSRVRSQDGPRLLARRIVRQ